MRKLFEFYAEDLKNRGKGEGSQERVEYTALAVETTTPELLNKAVGAITDADIFAFRNGRRRAGTKPSTINRDPRTIRAALKLARPDYRFPGGASSRKTRRGYGGCGPRRSCWCSNRWIHRSVPPPQTAHVARPVSSIATSASTRTFNLAAGPPRRRAR